MRAPPESPASSYRPTAESSDAGIARSLSISRNPDGSSTTQRKYLNAPSTPLAKLSNQAVLYRTRLASRISERLSSSGTDRQENRSPMQLSGRTDALRS